MHPLVLVTGSTGAGAGVPQSVLGHVPRRRMNRLVPRIPHIPGRGSPCRRRGQGRDHRPRGELPEAGSVPARWPAPRAA